MTTKIRQNKTATLAYIPSSLGDKNPKGYVTGGYVPQPKPEGAALPINKAAITRRGTYRTGDGDIPVAMRPGANDHLKYKSLINNQKGSK